MINLNNIKYNYIFIITILFFSFIGIIQKGYADNSITKTKNECEIIKSYNKDYTTIYHYTDDGEMAEHNIPNKKMNAIIKTYMLDPLPASASIVLYDKYKNKIGKLDQFFEVKQRGSKVKKVQKKLNIINQQENL